MPQSIYRRILPPEFLQSAASRNVDVGAYQKPYQHATDVWVDQTAGQYANACGLCTCLENEYSGKGYPWIVRTRRSLTDPPKQILE